MKVSWQLVQNWLVFELVVTFVLLIIPSRLVHSLRETWTIPTFGPVITVVVALGELGFATMIAVLLIYIALGTAQALGINPKKS